MNKSGGNQRVDKGKGGGKKYSRKRKVCHFCSDRIDYIDYKDEKLLRSYIPERGKILPRRISGVCAIHQRKLMEAVKRARNIAILPYTTL
ncbi:MAG: 30S ribosomal protein S18 [Acidobacteria bacterium]|nr:30S ribosomal protein S18 [Acidobacteriota bacterium]